MRVLGLDYGSKTVGVALSDPLGLTAQGVEIIRRERENKLRKTLARIEELVKTYDVERIVLGFPKNLDNSVGTRAQATLEFKDMLEARTGLPVELWDERLSTVEAHRALSDSGLKGKEHGQYIDEVAAVLILQGWMDAHPACSSK